MATMMKLQPFSGVRPAATSRSVVRVECNRKVVKKSKVVLSKDLPGIGKEGEIRSVPVGYYRNYLLPNSLAAVATQEILDVIRKEKEGELRKKMEEKAAAQAFANALSTIGKFMLKKKTGEKDNIYGSVTVQEVADAIYQQTGRKLADAAFTVPEIKAVGTYECTVRLHPEVVGTFSVVIQKEKAEAAKKTSKK